MNIYNHKKITKDISYFEQKFSVRLILMTVARIKPLGIKTADVNF